MEQLKTETILDHVRESLIDVKTYVNQQHNVGGEYTDFAAQLNAINNALDELNETVKKKIKNDLVSNNRTITEGDKFIGEIVRSDTSTLDAKKVREFLGKQLPRFLNYNKKITLTYKAKGI